jgi:hypothetical protein
MSEPTIIDAEYKEPGAVEFTLEDRVGILEGHIKALFEQHKNILENFIEAMEAVAEITKESYEE